MDIQQVERMRHLWKDARSKYASFFTCLSEVRREIGDDALEAWCRSQLMIGLTAINKASGLLQSIDAERTRSELSNISRASRDQRELEVHARKLAKIEREIELAAKQAEKTAIKTKQEDHEKRAKKAAEAAENKRRRKEKGDPILRAKEAILANPEAPRDMILKTADIHSTHFYKAQGLLEGAGLISPKKSDDDEVDLYNQYVREGRLAINHQWTLGDLAVKVSELRVYGKKTLDHYAMDIGVEYPALRAYLATAKKWPEIVTRITFSIARILATHPDRFAIVANDPYISCDEAREIMQAYRASSNVVSLK